MHKTFNFYKNSNVLMYKSAVLHGGRKWCWRKGNPCHGLSKESCVYILLFRDRYLKLTLFILYSVNSFLYKFFTNCLIMHFFQVPILKVMSQENCPSTTKVTSAPWCLLLPLKQCNPLCTSQVHHCQAVHLLNQQRYPRLPVQSHGSMETAYNQLFRNET